MYASAPVAARARDVRRAADVRDVVVEAAGPGLVPASESLRAAPRLPVRPAARGPPRTRPRATSGCSADSRLKSSTAPRSAPLAPNTSACSSACGSTGTAPRRDRRSAGATPGSIRHAARSACEHGSRRTAPTRRRSTFSASSIAAADPCDRRASASLASRFERLSRGSADDAYRRRSRRETAPSASASWWPRAPAASRSSCCHE